MKTLNLYKRLNSLETQTSPADYFVPFLSYHCHGAATIHGGIVTTSGLISFVFDGKTFNFDGLDNESELLKQLTPYIPELEKSFQDTMNKAAFDVERSPAIQNK